MLPSGFIPYTTWLLPLGLLATFSTGELEFYQDALPDKSEEVVFRQLARYLESQNRHQKHEKVYAREPERDLHERRIPQLLPMQSQQSYNNRLLEMTREKERDLGKDLDDKKNIDNIRRKLKFNPWKYQPQLHYNDPLNDMILDREYNIPYSHSGDLGRLEEEYPSVFKPPRENLMNKGPMFNTNDDNRRNEYRGYRQSFNYHPKQTSNEFFFNDEIDDTMNDEKPNELPYSESKQFHDTSRNNKISLFSGDERSKPQLHDSVPEFTFLFDQDNSKDDDSFAVKPNNPKYFEDLNFQTATKNELNLEKTGDKWPEDHNRQSMPSISNIEEPVDFHDDHITEEGNNSGYKHIQTKTNIANHPKFKELRMSTLPEPERHTRYHPIVVPVNKNLNNNNIYFIAVVAGCSAAAMFALVLISLTWCRLQRDAKAAADIEYPAYGVTGPNKDVSPSGDQRLAQSAQMYHFQHQKQQIIAMENRASATRDPGSVSEAESDEENEGDYTVYECPGLAPTGEMEVKNPLFHDDPTPATPAESNKEDHM